MKGALRLDAGQTRFLLRQLEEIEAEVMEAPRAPLVADRLVPARPIERGLNKWGISVWDGVGMARMMATKADDMPYVETFAREELFDLYDFGLGYHISLREIEAAARANIPLQSDKLARVRLGHEATRERFVLLGDDKVGVPGFIDNPNVPIFTLPNGGWLAGTGEDIAEDWAAAIAEVRSITQRLYPVNRVVMPPSRYTSLKSRLFSAAGQVTNQTILQFLLNPDDENSEPIIIEQLEELETAGVGGVPRIIFYRRDPSVVEQRIQIPFDQLDPEQDGFLVKVPCRSAYGGTTWKVPIAAVYADNS